MKKIVLSLAIMAGFAFSASAQTDAKAKVILADVSKKYRAYDIVRAGFTFLLDNPQAKIKEIQKGKLTVQIKTNKYHVDMTKLALISDGKSQWTYLKEDKEVQVSSVDSNSDALNPAKIFTIYEKGFKYQYIGEDFINKRTHQMIDLSPIDISKSYFKIRLGVDKATHRISRAVIFDKGGSKYTYEIQTFESNVKVPESEFFFDVKKNTGVEVVDLR